jgi:hypothetical protein
MQYEKLFNESLKQIEVLAKDAGIFRDSIAGKEDRKIMKERLLSLFNFLF